MAGAAPYPVHAQRAHPGRGLAFPVGNNADGNAVCEALWHVFLVFRRCKVIRQKAKSQEEKIKSPRRVDPGAEEFILDCNFLSYTTRHFHSFLHNKDN